MDLAARPYKPVTTQSGAATSLTDSGWENEFKMKRHTLVLCGNLLKIHEAARVHERRTVCRGDCCDSLEVIELALITAAVAAG